MPTPEGLVKSDIAKTLAFLEASGYIIWFERLNSLSIHQPGIHINGTRPGTFDFICIFQDNKRNLCVMFIEAKRDDKPSYYSQSQKKFLEKYNNKHPNIFFVLCTSGKQVKHEIVSRCYDRLQDITL